MDSFFALPDAVAVVAVVILLAVLLLEGVSRITTWFEKHPKVTVHVQLLIGACVIIPMVLLIGLGIGHLTYVALVATYSWFTT